MKTASLLLLIGTLLLGVTGHIIKENEPKTNLECIDNNQDFWWSSSPPWSYASSGDRLPGLLRGKLEGNGIFYQESAQNLYVLTDLGVSQPGPPEFNSNYIYVKYYIHIHTEAPEKQLIVFPALYPDNGDVYKYMPRTTDFIWREETVELNELEFEDHYGGIGALKFDEDEYIVVEKIILAQGFNFTSTNPTRELKTLCGWDDDEPTESPVDPTDSPIDPTTDSPVDPTESPVDPTSESPVDPTDSPVDPTTGNPVDPTTKPPSGVCTGEGIFPDPKDCQKFHVCQLDDQGNIWDSEFTCPSSTVWCQKTLECENEDICPCTI